MGKIAFVFPGQGTQHRGMGHELCVDFPEAGAVFGMADFIRPGTSEQCFSGSDDELARTLNSQPCLFAVELAAARCLVSKGVRPDSCAGFSLGELTAVVFAGIMDDETGFSLVCRRGELMQEASDAVDSAMAAVIRLTDFQVEELCESYKSVFPVNYNCPGQVTVSGLRDELSSFSADVKKLGGRAVPLKVGGAFHSPFMAGASEKFAIELENTVMNDPSLKVYSDLTAMPYEGDYRRLLSEQIKGPVRWQKIVENMILDGVDTFIELGPGKTLCGFIEKTDKNVRTLHVEDRASLEQTLKEVGVC